MRPLGLSRLMSAVVKRAGLVAGALLFLAAVAFMQTRVLAVKVTGSGAYLEAQISDILSRGGVKRFAAPPKELAPIRAEVLSLPRVSFCSIKREGGVLTVCVEVVDESTDARKEPLLSPAAGTVRELVVVRGTPCVQEGDEVRAGQTVVESYALFGEERRPVIVIAQVTVSYVFSVEYPLPDEESARAQTFLDFGAAEDLQVTKTEGGWLVEGTAFATAAVNLG